MKKIKKISAYLAVLFVSCTVLNNAAQAGTATSDFQPTANLNATCQVTGGAINFGNLTLGVGTTSSTGSITMLCSNHVAYDIAFSAGNS